MRADRVRGVSLWNKTSRYVFVQAGCGKTQSFKSVQPKRSNVQYDAQPHSLYTPGPWPWLTEPIKGGCMPFTVKAMY